MISSGLTIAEDRCLWILLQRNWRHLYVSTQSNNSVLDPIDTFDSLAFTSPNRSIHTTFTQRMLSSQNAEQRVYIISGLFPP